MSQQPKLFFLFSIILFAVSCKSTKRIGTTPPSGPKNIQDSLQVLFDDNLLFQKIFTGFALFDPSKNQSIFESNAHQYYTPASNTKIFTLYSASQILGDSIPGLRYEIKGDSLLFWGTADPTLLFNYLPDSNRIIEFLQSRKEQLIFCPGNFKDDAFGAGWAWDDYFYAYQVDKAPMPIYGNRVQFKGNPAWDQINIFPSAFRQMFQWSNEVRTIERAIDKNIFYLHPKNTSAPNFRRNVGFRYENELFTQLLSEAVGKPIRLGSKDLLPSSNSKYIYSQEADILYQEMMQNSDNFIAEQLVLMCGEALSGEMNTNKAIKILKDSLLSDLPDEPIWRDGSGLSRYNLFTPRSIIKLLHKIHQSMEEERIFTIFPAGGISGTIRNWYGAETPYVFAKTGTISNKHCLSGFLKTKKGQTLIFSFMHNNYIGSSSPTKVEMTKVLEYIRDNY